MAEGRKIRLTIVGTQYLPEVAPQSYDRPAEHSDLTAAPQSGAEQPAVTRMQVEALYYKRGDSHYLFYEEQPEGFPEPMKTRLKFRQDYLELTRQGTFGCRMVYETGKSYRTDYPTPYGSLALDIVTASVRLEQGEDGTERQEDGSQQEDKLAQREDGPRVCPCVTVEYRLENEGQPIGNYRLRLEMDE